MPIVEGWSGSAVDVAVIGAGAAGLAAAEHLGAQDGLSVLVLEAGARIGGRAYTAFAPGLDAPLDLGCGWLHGGRTNSWTAIADRLGFTVDRRPAPWTGGDHRLVGLSPADRESYQSAAGAFYGRVEAVAASGADRAMGDLIEPGERWRGMFESISTYMSGAELDKVSCLDYERYDPGEGPDWRVEEGYGRLVAAYGAKAPVMLDAAVSRIDHAGRDEIRIETRRGVLSARAAIVTVSTDVLAGGAIAFTPALPEKLGAATDLPLGLANKLFLRVTDPEDLPAETYRLGSPFRTTTGAYHIRPFGRPVIEMFYGGQVARDLEREGDEAVAAFALEELAGLFGADTARRLVPLRASAWAGEPHIRGSYSYAKPGAAGSRAVLAAPVDERLFFAGEACSPQAFTTAHGAHDSGVAAAGLALAGLRRRRRAAS